MTELLPEDAPTLAINLIEGDDFITDPEIADNVIFSGHETGIPADKPLVFKLREGSPDQDNEQRHTLFSTNADRSGTDWRVSFTPAEFAAVGNGSYTATISDPMSGTQAIRVVHVDHNDPNQPESGDPPASPFLAYDAVEGDNVVTPEELADGVVLHGHTKDIQENTTLNLYLKHENEDQVFLHPVVHNNGWSVDLTASDLHAGNYDSTIEYVTTPLQGTKHHFTVLSNSPPPPPPPEDAIGLHTYDDTEAELRDRLSDKGVPSVVRDYITDHTSFHDYSDDDKGPVVPVEVVSLPFGKIDIEYKPDEHGKNPQVLIVEPSGKTVNTDLDPSLKFVIEASDTDAMLNVIGSKAGVGIGTTDPGSDTIVSSSSGAHETLLAGDADDTKLQSGSGAHDLVQAGDGANDTLIAGSGAGDTVIAGDGDKDLLQAGSGAHQLLQAGDGAGDTLIGGSGAWQTLQSGDGDGDVLQAGSGSHQSLQAGDGSGDTLVGGSGAWDTLTAGDGGDVLKAGNGVLQLLQAGDGDDTLYAGSGGDTLNGGGGDDAFHVPGSGDDTIDGSPGQDTVYFDNHAFDANVHLTENSGVVTEVKFTDTAQTIKLSNVEELVFNMSGGTTMSNIWVSEGPSPGINGQETVPPNNQINGAIQAIAVNPTNPNIMYVATVNGGIWETRNATAATPQWVPLTETLPSLSMGALAFDPTDATHQTLIAGIGATSSFYALHNTLSGVLRTTDGGTTWSQLGTAALAGDNITSVAARGTTLLAAADSTWSPSGANGLFRSTDTGTTWTNISDGNHGLPNNVSVSDVVGDPLNPNVFYAGVTGATGGVFKSTDGGLTWTNISAGIGIINITTDKILLAVHDDGTHVAVFATVDNASVLSGVFQSLDGGGFKALDVPSGGAQGFVHGSISADPSNPNIVYVGYGGGGNEYLTRIDASETAGSQITALVGGSFGSPHVDPRDMQIDANGNLILSTDGGLFSLPTPTVNTGAWKAIGGDIGDFELHDIAYDHVSKIIVAGSQDNGTLSQLTPGGTTWTNIFGGDGGDVAIDDVSLAGVNQSIRYVSAQFLAGWQRQVYDSANKLVSITPLAGISDGQFVTPVEVNTVDPTHILVGGLAHIYMSSNQGTTLTAIANAGVNSSSGNDGGDLMVYGGYQNGVANPDLIYAASGADVLRETTAGGGFTSTAPGGETIVGVTDDPDSWATVFAIDNDQVFESTDAGGIWVDVTQNLTSISGLTFYSIAYVPGTVDDALVVGTNSGVFAAHVSGLGGAAAWSQFGALPDVIVHDLQYDAHDNVLVAATMGRGAWLISAASLVPTLPVMLNAVSGANNLTTLSGTAEANSSVSVFDGVNLVGIVTAASDGTWSLQANVKGNAIHSFTETSTDSAGNVASSAGVTLYTPAANKALVGGDGNDVLIGRPNDTLTGGPGADTLVFNPSFGKETVKDYNVNQDVLAFSHTLFANDTASQVLSQTHDSSAGAVIVVDSVDTVTLEGVTVAQLQAAQQAHVDWLHFF